MKIFKVVSPNPFCNAPLVSGYQDGAGDRDTFSRYATSGTRSRDLSQKRTNDGKRKNGFPPVATHDCERTMAHRSGGVANGAEALFTPCLAFRHGLSVLSGY